MKHYEELLLPLKPNRCLSHVVPLPSKKLSLEIMKSSLQLYKRFKIYIIEVSKWTSVADVEQFRIQVEPVHITLTVNG